MSQILLTAPSTAPDSTAGHTSVASAPVSRMIAVLGEAVRTELARARPESGPRARSTRHTSGVPGTRRREGCRSGCRLLETNLLAQPVGLAHQGLEEQQVVVTHDDAHDATAHFGKTRRTVVPGAGPLTISSRPRQARTAEATTNMPCPLPRGARPKPTPSSVISTVLSAPASNTATLIRPAAGPRRAQRCRGCC